MATLHHHRKPHALAVPVPFQGHIQPLLGLSLRLISAGFMVTFANTHTNHRRITGEQNGTTTTQEFKEVGDLHFTSLGEEFCADHDNPVDSLVDMLKPEMRDAVASLLARLNKKGPPVSLLMFDFRLVFVLDLAIAAGIPSLSLWTQNAANFVCNAIASQGFQFPADESTLFTCALGVPPLTRKEISGLSVNGMLLSDEYMWLPFRRVSEPTWIALNTFEELEATTLDSTEKTIGFRPLALGPLVNVPSFSISRCANIQNSQVHLDWLQWHPKHSVLYIAFGSLANVSQEQLEEIVLGLEASRQPFLWVFRVNFCVESKHTLDSLTKRFENQGLLLHWAPQRDVLSHPSVGGFLTHCGWNSTIESMNAGIPMLTWPIFVDQFLNQRCIIEQWGVGLGFEASNGLITRMEIERKVNDLMQSKRGEEMRNKAKKLSNSVQEAYEGGGSSCKYFDGLKEELLSLHLKRQLKVT